MDKGGKKREGVPRPNAVQGYQLSILLLRDTRVRYLNTNAPYQHHHVMPYDPVSVWHVQPLLYSCTEETTAIFHQHLMLWLSRQIPETK